MAMLNRNVVGIALIVTLLILLSGCATSGMSRLEREQAYDDFIVSEKLEELNRITTFRFTGWNDLSDRHLILHVGVNRYYLVTLRNYCFDLDNSISIRFNNTGATLRSKFDSITVPSDPHMRCFIETIHEISKEQRNTLLTLHKEDADEAIDKQESKAEEKPMA